MPAEFRGGRENEPPLRRPGAQPPETRSADDLRVQPFTDDVFSEYQARRKDNSGASFGLIAGLVIGVAAVGGIGWYMYSSGALTMGGQGGTPQIVKADQEPYKVKPKDPGGMQVENQDKLVYDRVAKGEAPARVENLLPAPEEPKAPPKPAAAPAEAAKPEPVPVETAKTEPANPAPEPVAVRPEPPPPEAANEVAKAAPAKPVEPAKPEQDDLAALVAAATGGREAATGPIATKPAASASEQQVAAVPPISEPPPASVAPVAPPTATPGAFQIQLASARSEQGAMGEWNRISAKNKDALGELTPNVARVDLGEKGVFFRLRAGPVADRAAADSICAALSAQNVGCIVVRP